MCGVGVDVPARREPITAESAEVGIFVAAPAEEEIVVLRHPPIGSDVARIFIERRFERRQVRKILRANTDGRILFGLLVIAEPEETVLDRGAADIEAILLAVEIRLGRREVRARGVLPPAAADKPAAVTLVAAARGHDVDRAGRADARRRVGGRCRNLKLLNALLREVDSRRADVFVNSVNAVNRDSRLAPVAAAERDAGVAALGRVE